MGGVNTGSSWIYGEDRKFPYETAVRPKIATVFTLSQQCRKSSAQTSRLLRWLCLLWSLARGRFGDAGGADPRGLQSHEPTVPSGLLQPPNWGKRAVSAMAECLQDGEKDGMESHRRQEA